MIAVARAIAATERKSLGKVVSELARKGLGASKVSDRGFPTFEVPADAPPLTPELVERALDE